jgi:hypothetical protein
MVTAIEPWWTAMDELPREFKPGMVIAREPADKMEPRFYVFTGKFSPRGKAIFWRRATETLLKTWWTTPARLPKRYVLTAERVEVCSECGTPTEATQGGCVACCDTPGDV